MVEAEAGPRLSGMLGILPTTASAVALTGASLPTSTTADQAEHAEGEKRSCGHYWWRRSALIASTGSSYR